MTSGIRSYTIRHRARILLHLALLALGMNTATTSWSANNVQSITVRGGTKIDTVIFSAPENPGDSWNWKLEARAASNWAHVSAGQQPRNGAWAIIVEAGVCQGLATFTAQDSEGQEVTSTWEVDRTDGVFPTPFPEGPSTSVTFGSNETGVYVVRGTKAYESPLSDESTVAFVDLQIVDKAGATKDTLSVSMWEGAFNLKANPPPPIDFDKDFIDSDSRLFYVRLLGLDDVDTVTATITADHPQFGPPRDIYLTRQQGFHQSQSMILVSNAVDDAERHGANTQVISGGSNHDRTILARLGGSVDITAEYEHGSTLTRSASVPAKGTAHLRALVLVENGNQLIKTRRVVEHLYTARETFAQIGVHLTWTIEFPSVPAGVSFADDIVLMDASDRLTGEVKQLIDRLKHDNQISDMCLFYVYNLRDPLTTYVLGTQTRRGRLHAGDLDYADNVFISVKRRLGDGSYETLFRPFTLGHEFFHVLANNGDHRDGVSDPRIEPWNLMYRSTSTAKNDIANTKRLDADQEP